MLLSVLLGCTPAVPDLVSVQETGLPTDTGDTVDSIPSDDSDDSDDTPDSEEPEPVVTEEVVDPQPDDEDSTLFDDNVIHTIEITLPSGSITGLGIDPYSKVPGNITIDGTTMPDIGVRLRGKIGSFRTLSGKPKFAIDMNFTHEDQRYLGVEELSLNNEVVDCGYMKEPLSYKIMRDAGVPAGRTSFAQVTVNGEEYGLYVIVETPDDRFLIRNFTDPTGNLYDGKYIWYGGSSYTLLDFKMSVADLFQLEEGTDVGHADVYSVVAALTTDPASDTWYADVSAVVDIPAFVNYIAVEQLVGHNDGYSMNTNNYRLYFDPERDGKMVFVPWDFDYAYLHDYEWGFSWLSPQGDLSYACFSNPQCRAEHDEAVTKLLDSLDVPALQEWYDERVALIKDAARADPRRECSQYYVTYYQSYVRGWLDSEPASIKAFWGLE